MASGLNMLPMITKEIKLDDVPENIIRLQTDRKECKISCSDPGMAATKVSEKSARDVRPGVETLHEVGAV